MPLASSVATSSNVNVTIGLATLPTHASDKAPGRCFDTEEKYCYVIDIYILKRP